MRRTYANFWSSMASELTAIAHTRASMFRVLALLALAIIWIWAGLTGWLAATEGAGRLSASEALYRTLGALTVQDGYRSPPSRELEIARFAGVAVPLIGLLFAFSGALGRSLARMFNLGAAKHVVIAGDSPAALTLASDCCRHGDAVILIGQDLSEDTALGLRRRGVIVVEGEATRADTLAAARAHHAAHVVAFEADDTANLQIEAAVRRLVGDAKRRPPIGVHVATASPMLLKEAREMRAQQTRAQINNASIDPKPFSLDEIAARSLIQTQAQTMLESAAYLGLDRLHIVFFGFDDAAEAVAACMFRSMWSQRFGAPKLTVLTPDPQGSEGRFRARHGEAFAHPQVWSADITFLAFDWNVQSMGASVLDLVERERGKPCAAIVSTGADPSNIHLAIALGRICNFGLRWPIPIFMKESARSEFSQTYAKGDETEEVDAYLQAFGARQDTAKRAILLGGELDRGAAIAHQHYNKHLSGRDPLSLKDLQAAMRGWPEVFETYRAANRAAADSALVKLWDAGWNPAPRGVRGDTAPDVSDEILKSLAKTEHDRWMAERLIAGWRPAPAGGRDNDLMMHDNLVPWEALTEDLKARDEVQVLAAIDVARMLYPNGFLRAGQTAPEAPAATEDEAST
jgi:hypothetical protein